MSDPTVPQWAYDRVDALKGTDSHYRNVFAAYVAAQEEPPVDPLLIEARGIVVSTSYGGAENWASEWRERTLAGRHDEEDRVRVALFALRRGIELGQSK